MNTFNFDLDIYMIFSNLDPLEWILSYPALMASGGSETYLYICDINDEILTTVDGLLLTCTP